MALPVGGSFRTGKVELSGGDVAIRELSYAEGKQIGGDRAVARMISFATETPLDETEEWIGKASAADVMALTTAINNLSGFGEGAQKSG